MSFLNHVVEFVRVLASEVSGPNAAVLYDVAGVAGFRYAADGTIEGDDTSDAAGELDKQEPYQALGIVGRPLPPEGDLFLESLALRSADGLIPFAHRDLRINRALNPGGGSTTPREGQILFAGYGGAFVGHSMTAESTGTKRGNVTTIYVPYDFDAQGVPQKAHAISIDPSDGNSSISIVHGSGVFFSLTENAGGGGPGIVWAIDAQTFGRMSPGEFMVNAARITMKGNVYIGRTPEAGAPLLGGPISPPCPSLFVSPA